MLSLYYRTQPQQITFAIFCRFYFMPQENASCSNPYGAGKTPYFNDLPNVYVSEAED
jgi:hypothetical protein